MKTPKDIAAFFSVLSDETRIKILLFLNKSELSVNEIREKLNDISLPGVTYQLNLLKDMNIVKYQKEKRKHIYSISDYHVIHILSDAIQHMIGGPECAGTLNCQENQQRLIEEIDI